MATVESSDSSSDARQSQTTVLFVDDEPDILELYDLLCRTEYTVLTAHNGRAALEQFGDHVDIAFFDRRMPDMSGGEVIDTLRDQGYQTPVGIISAIEPEVGDDIESDAYLTKPINREKLFETIDDYTS
jgi:Response regulator containing CheY-like receiver, AAA-type ATPase, and DNA-binding domains